MADLSSRSLLPDGARNFTFSTVPQPESREKHKNYVFVDEHNRHRRLKVMRACAACRRRKIKCDAATTNTWPCAPCVKQQLECVPPSSDKDGQDLSPEEQKQANYHAYQPGVASTSPQSVPDYSQQVHVPASYGYGSSVPSATSEYFHSSISGSEIQSHSLGADSMTPLTPQDFPQQGFPPPPFQRSPTQVSASGMTHKSDSPDAELASVLQDLKIDQVGIAPYIANQQALADPRVEEQEPPALPPQSYSNTSTRIPPEMWPSEQQAKQYFDYFFSNIHPYVPVVDRTSFYQLWQYDRYQIPPLILEGIFACSAHMLNHLEERNRWLALATRHEENLKDVPRLGTVQGLVLIMKARETTPRRGYYYRSWMGIQYMISMAKDLGLHHHNKCHVEGKPCGSEAFECVLKTRIWYSLFQLETMVGGPQGRYDFSIELDTVDLHVPQSLPGFDFSELKISQDQTYFARLIYNIRSTINAVVRVKASGTNCATDEAFLRLNQEYVRFGDELPPHLRVKYPDDASPPSIPFHLAANLQCYQLLGIIMHHRPQLESRTQNFDDGSWKDIMFTCYDAATKICRLHEAIMQSYGLNGILCMVRGINTAIYTILSCTMLHLVALTSPDPDLSDGARDYFTRNMRILEQCSSSWPVPQMQVQIDSLRQAFSADLSKPFELKANFPFGSPAPDADTSTPPADSSFFAADGAGHQQAVGRHIWGNAYEAQPITPPQTAGSMRSHQDMIPTTSFSGSDQQYVANTSMGWDPSGVIDKWQTAFGQSSMESPSPGISGATLHGATVAPTSAPMYSNTQQPSYFNASNAIAATQAGISQTFPAQTTSQQPGYLPQASTVTPSTYGPSMQNFVTPSMWQDAVARTYGSKRRYDGDLASQSYKRMR